MVEIMSEKVKQAKSDKTDSQPISTPNPDSDHRGIQLEDVRDKSTWEAYQRWRMPRK